MSDIMPPLPDIDAYLQQDQRLFELLAAQKLPLPENEILAQAYRRRGDLAGAADEYARLRAAGKNVPGGPLFEAIFGQGRAPVRAPESEFAPVPFVLFEQVFAAGWQKALLAHAIANEQRYQPTELEKSDPYGNPLRATAVYPEMGEFGDDVRNWVREQLPLLCNRLNMPSFGIELFHLKIAAYRDGDFFAAHQDNKLRYPDRKISFIYYFHREPKPYSGGDLLLFDTRLAPTAYVRRLFTRFVPCNNSMIFFPSEYFHEVLPVIVSSKEFGDSRFTIAGHIG